LREDGKELPSHDAEYFYGFLETFYSKAQTENHHVNLTVKITEAAAVAAVLRPIRK